MELGANRKSLTQLAVLLVLLAVVVYFQFLRESGVPVQSSSPPRLTVSAPDRTATRQTPDTQPTPRRFQPRLGGTGGEDTLNPMTADATIRRDRLERLQEIEEPSVERNIFNFGRPKPVTVYGPTREELEAAQRLLEQTRTPPPARPPQPVKPEPPRQVIPPDWKYYGLASLPSTDTRRGFLLDDEEILVVAEGAVVRDQYRIEAIGLSEIEIEDLHAGQSFSIRLEVPR